MINKYKKRKKCLLTTIITVTLLSTIIIPLNQTTNIVKADTVIKNSKGFEKGITWQPFIPIKKTIFVNFDKNSLVDDYSYLASIPASVFSDGETIYTNPLLFFQAENTYPDEDQYRFLNDYPGTHYLMEDWMEYCNGKLDKLTLINVDKNQIETTWDTKEYTSINSKDPYEIASKIALDEWSYSDEAVIAVIEEDYEQPKNSETSGYLKGDISGNVGHEQLTVDRPFGPSSIYEKFEIGDEYKYTKIILWYPSFAYHSKIFETILPAFKLITIPSVDADLQVFCKYDGDWLETGAEANTIITAGPCEEVRSYVYNPGEWRVGVTNMPTEGGDESFIKSGPLRKIDIYGSLKGALNSLIKGVDQFNVDITKYPGIELDIPKKPAFGCRDATFTLTWEGYNDIALGLTIIGPNGEEIDSVMEKDVDSQEIKMEVIGECLEDENYKVVVYALDDITTPINFRVDYSWNQNISKKEGDLLASASQGAILGSIKNNPLLFTKPDNLPSDTKKTLLKLGVKKVDIVNLGGYLSDETTNKISDVVEINKNYKGYKEVYNKITKITNSNDIVFSTIDPWSYWYYKDKGGELQPDGEYKKAYHFAPAAYAAALHGTPLLLTDNHPELSGAVTWHGDFWRKNAHGLKSPPIGCMFLTGKKVYDFLNEYGFDKKGAESILTVAGQYEIGPTWTRMFTGPYYPGSIIGTPVDVSNHIARCTFYPALIFENPALQGEVELTNGSKSVRAFHVDDKLLNIFNVLRTRLSLKSPGLSNLNIYRPSQKEKYELPVLHSFGCYSHRVNERAADYWGVTYKTRDGYTPGEDLSGKEIDQGTRELFEGKKGSFLPDLSPSVYTPFYAEKAGYSNAFSTNFEITMENLNQGVISWYMINHGDSSQGGWLSWWEPISDAASQLGIPEKLAKLIDPLFGFFTGSSPYSDTNPWRCYEMWWGSTDEPDSAVLNSKIGIIPGFTNKINPLFDSLNRGLLKTGLDIVPSHLSGYYDGQVGPMSITGLIGKFHFSHPATEVDDMLQNLHSMSFHAGSCLIGCNYLQILMMRHGSVLQEMDPWSTSYWSSYIIQQIPKDYALGESVGESYAKGIIKIGPQYIFEEGEERVWWWDTLENVVLACDPDVHIWVPSTEWDELNRNHWERNDIQSLSYDEESNIDGHMPFGADSYPHERELGLKIDMHILIIILVIILILIITIARYKKRNK